jgi:sulfatase modifying factor 1
MNKIALSVTKFRWRVGSVTAVLLAVTAVSTLAGELGATKDVWRPLGRNSQGYEEYLWLKDSSAMVEVPDGYFTMGADDDFPCEKPAHQVYLDEFWIDKYEVTNRQYKQFCDATGHRYPRDPGEFDVPDYFKSRPDYPVVNVSWDDANAYCNWVGKRLPTEAEWEKAARGTDARKYPWGNRRPGSGSARYGNFADEALGRWRAGGPGIHGYDDGYPNTAPVGSFPAGASPYGCLDMEGNVYEWCNDYYGGEDYYSGSTKNPTGPPSGWAHAIRSSSWDRDAADLPCARRGCLEPSRLHDGLGFRCCGPRSSDAGREVIQPAQSERDTPNTAQPSQNRERIALPTSSTTPNAGGDTITVGNEKKWEKDGSVMVRVPAGSGVPPV